MKLKLHSNKQIDFEQGPRFSLIIPFNPKMKNPKLLFNMLKSAGNKAEKEIKEKYSAEQALSLIKVLRCAIKEVKCSLNEKTLAIFVSRFAKNIYYFTPTKLLAMPSVLVSKPI